MSSTSNPFASPSEPFTSNLKSQRAKASKFVDNELRDAFYRVNNTQYLIDAARALLEAERLTPDDRSDVLGFARKIEDHAEALRRRADRLWTMVEVLEELVWEEKMAEGEEE